MTLACLHPAVQDILLEGQRTPSLKGKAMCWSKITQVLPLLASIPLLYCSHRPNGNAQRSETHLVCWLLLGVQKLLERFGYQESETIGILVLNFIQKLQFYTIKGAAIPH
jgi:hypothetical protein